MKILCFEIKYIGFKRKKKKKQKEYNCYNNDYTNSGVYNPPGTPPQLKRY